MLYEPKTPGPVWPEMKCCQAINVAFSSRLPVFTGSRRFRQHIFVGLAVGYGNTGDMVRFPLPLLRYGSCSNNYFDYRLLSPVIARVPLPMRVNGIYAAALREA